MPDLIPHLEIQGVFYRRGDQQRAFLPYHLLSKANETYGRFHKGEECTLVPIELLPIPGVQFTWKMFEKLDHALDVSKPWRLNNG